MFISGVLLSPDTTVISFICYLLVSQTCPSLLLDLPTAKIQIGWHLTEALTSRDVSRMDRNSRETGSTEIATNALVLHGGEATCWPLDREIFKFISSPQVLMSPL